MKEPTFNWGIIGLGGIAHKFASDLTVVKGARLVSVASRSQEKANQFAERYGVPKAYGTYEDLLQDPSIDAVYIATPHVLHASNAIQVMSAGKAALVEKPFAMNSRESQKMIQTAKERGIFLMEAFWTRFHPSTRKVMEWINEGRIGTVQTVEANFCFKAPFNPDKRIFNKALGGGALLDIGVYPLFLSLLVLGRPQKIQALSKIGNTGVDEITSVIMEHENASMSIQFSSIIQTSKVDARIYGSKGWIYMHPRWHNPTSLTWYDYDKKQYTDEGFNFVGTGYNYQVEEVHQCLSQGLFESPLMPHQFSQMLMETMDQIRQQIGLVYPEHDHIQ
ncbi:MAG: Gfo/Idh/MocA family oxidoreductase [Bacteroidota bacterium]